ncbi:hypothetical protein ACIRBX_09300 [Kitasatospora sp. NPDC096147]|uniref:hypothetical protein n=1 Tax=Kitasatospora sp. NPDC096147 TaxID=3364093 RepID=UPI003819B024
MGLARLAGPLGLASTLTLAAATAGAATPSPAAPELRLELRAPASVVLGPGGTGSLPLRVRRVGGEGTRDVLVTFDARRLRGVAELHLPDGCSTAGTVQSCPGPLLPDLDPAPSDPGTGGPSPAATGPAALPGEPSVTAAAGAGPGSRGVLHVSATAADSTPAELDVEVLVDGPRLTIAPLPKAERVRPGSALDTVLEITNSGALPARRLRLVMLTEETLTFGQRFGNCEYGTRPRGTDDAGLRPAGSAVICTLDSPVGAGETVRLDPLRIGVTPAAYRDRVGFTVLAEYQGDAEQTRGAYEFGPGSGPLLAIAERRTGSADRPTTGSASTELEVRTESGADFEAVGRWAPAGDGRTGTLTVGLHNNGPAAISARTAGRALPTLGFTLPDGVRATKVPAGCRATADGHGYGCRPGDWAPADLRADYDFALELAPGAGETSLTVSLQDATGSSGPVPTSAAMEWDQDPADDVVVLRLAGPSTARPTAAPRPSVAGIAPGTTASAPATGAGSAAAATGSPAVTRHPAAVPGPLASTGGGTPAGPTAALGGAAVTLGLGLIVLVARRRRPGLHRRPRPRR